MLCRRSSFIVSRGMGHLQVKMTFDKICDSHDANRYRSSLFIVNSMQLVLPCTCMHRRLALLSMLVRLFFSRKFVCTAFVPTRNVALRTRITMSSLASTFISFGDVSSSSDADTTVVVGKSLPCKNLSQTIFPLLLACSKMQMQKR